MYSLIREQYEFANGEVSELFVVIKIETEYGTWNRGKWFSPEEIQIALNDIDMYDLILDQMEVEAIAAQLAYIESLESSSSSS